MTEYRIEDRGGIEILAQCCASLDRAENLAEAIARDGEVVHSRTGVPKSHPAIRDELAARAFVCRTLERLGLNIETIKSQGRPPRSFGWTPQA
jgi:Phage terminase, small subunit